MEAFALSEIGKVRKENEDSFLLSSEGCLFAVADGMGGYAGGQLASSIAIRMLEQEVPSLHDNRGQGHGQEQGQGLGQEQVLGGEVLLKALQKANKMIFTQGKEEKFSGMGTTVTAVLLNANRLWIAHIGDSRAYLWRAGQIRQLTQDHSLVNELLQHGELTPEEAQNHPRRNVLTRALGVLEQPEIDFLELPIQNDDLLLLCTDGLYNRLAPAEIEGILAADQESVREKVEKMVHLALDRGGQDNITALLVRYGCDEQISPSLPKGKR